MLSVLRVLFTFALLSTYVVGDVHWSVPVVRHQPRGTDSMT